MKPRRLLLLLVALAAGLALAGAWWHRSARRAPAVVAIEDGRTIDFSSGHPAVKDTPQDRAALEKALKEMDEATKDVTFPATATATTPEAESAELPTK